MEKIPKMSGQKPALNQYSVRTLMLWPWLSRSVQNRTIKLLYIVGTDCNIYILGTDCYSARWRLTDNILGILDLAAELKTCKTDRERNKQKLYKLKGS